MANAMLDELNKSAEAKQNMAKQHSKGKASSLPPALSQLTPDELKKFLGLSVMKFMRGRMKPQKVNYRNLYRKADLNDKIAALEDSMNKIPTIQNFGRRSH